MYYNCHTDHLNTLKKQNINIDLMEVNKNQFINLNHNLSTKYQNNVSSSSIGYQYVATLKPAGYIIGQPISYSTNNSTNARYIPNQQRPITSTLGQDTTRIASRANSRIISSPGSDVIVHEHPSRPVRSPSPISQNPSANIVPHANFIYNSGNSAPRLPPPTMSRVVSYSPAKIPISQTYALQTASTYMVPRAQYDRCVSECKIWQQKYNQLYALYIETTKNNNQDVVNIKNKTNLNINSEEQQYIRQQNRKLKQRVKQLQRNQQKLYNNMEDIVVQLVNKYRDSLLKQSMLLVDRYRLQKKLNDR